MDRKLNRWTDIMTDTYTYTHIHTHTQIYRHTNRQKDGQIDR